MAELTTITVARQTRDRLATQAAACGPALREDLAALVERADRRPRTAELGDADARG